MLLCILFMYVLMVCEPVLFVSYMIKISSRPRILCKMLDFSYLVDVLNLCLQNAVKIFLLLYQISEIPWRYLVRVGKFSAGRSVTVEK
jgi:hypothetical protein